MREKNARRKDASAVRKGRRSEGGDIKKREVVTKDIRREGQGWDGERNTRN